MIDTHAHLNIKEFEDKIDEVLAFAKTNGVNKIIVIGMDEETNQKAINLSKNHDMLYATVGFHPSYLDQKLDYEKLEVMLNETQVVAVGETGIDLYWQQDNLDIQKDAFIRHINLALKYDLPIIIHSRNSFDETYELIKQHKGKLKGVFHCFSSNLEDAKKVIDLGLYIGIDGPITYKKNIELQNIVKEIDLKHILIETDSPYLTPVPFRGRKNEPGHVIEVAKMIAKIKEVSLNEVIAQTSSNAYKLFNFDGGYEK